MAAVDISQARKVQAVEFMSAYPHFKGAWIDLGLLMNTSSGRAEKVFDKGDQG